MRMWLHEGEGKGEGVVGGGCARLTARSASSSPHSKLTVARRGTPLHSSPPLKAITRDADASWTSTALAAGDASPEASTWTAALGSWPAGCQPE